MTGWAASAPTPCWATACAGSAPCRCFVPAVALHTSWEGCLLPPSLAGRSKWGGKPSRAPLLGAAPIYLTGRAGREVNAITAPLTCRHSLQHSRGVLATLPSPTRACSSPVPSKGVTAHPRELSWHLLHQEQKANLHKTGTAARRSRERSSLQGAEQGRVPGWVTGAQYMLAVAPDGVLRCTDLMREGRGQRGEGTGSNAH